MMKVNAPISLSIESERNIKGESYKIIEIERIKTSKIKVCKFLWALERN